MLTILPIQGTFDKAIPDNFGNVEYRAERELLIAINDIIGQCSLENPVIAYFLDVASVDSRAKLTSQCSNPLPTKMGKTKTRTGSILLKSACFFVEICRKTGKLTRPFQGRCPSG